MIAQFRKCPLLLTVAMVGALVQPLPGRDNRPAAPTNTLTLEGAIRTARENNPEHRASGARVEAAAGSAAQGRLWTNPELELSAEEWTVGSGRGFSGAKQTVGAAQTIPFPGKKSLDGKIGRAGMREAEAEHRLHRIELERDTKVAFFQALATESMVAASSNLFAVAQSAAATSQKRVEAGDIPFQEQLRAEIEMEQARTVLADGERNLIIARQNLAFILGLPALDGVALVGALAETPNPALLEQLPINFLEKHPAILASRANREHARYAESRARLEPYPDVKAGLAGGRLGETGESIVELRFSVPLPIFDRAKGKKTEAKANTAMAEARLAAVRQRLARDWETARQRYRTASGQAANYRQHVLPKAQEALRLVQTGYTEGKFKLIDLLDTRRTTAETQISYQQKLLEMNTARAELEALLAGDMNEVPPAKSNRQPTNLK